ncbi:MAG TPA: hypothetical protein VJ259_05555 [Actinomycetota bacterium]|nr:hypothetical protein [Actinomycetota bacterium]
MSEDFAFYLEKAPGAMFRLGVQHPARGTMRPLHHGEFTLDEDAIGVGAAPMLDAASRFLEGAADGSISPVTSSARPSPGSGDARPKETGPWR